MPDKNKVCIESWKKFCPDYDIVEWNESNYDFSKCIYMKQAYDAKMWGFVPDYARLDIIYREGGIYLDTDVEVIRNLDELLLCRAFMGFENKASVAPGLGFGAESGNEIIKRMRDMYEGCSFYQSDHTFNLIASPVYATEVLKSYGLKTNGKRQCIQDIDIFSAEYFAPLCYTDNRLKITPNTYSIHWYHASWYTPEQREQARRRQQINRIFGKQIGRIVNSGLYAIHRAGQYMHERGK